MDIVQGTRGRSQAQMQMENRMRTQRMLPESIVVGVDGSAPSDAAIRWAVAHAAHVDCPIVLAHVKDDDWGLVGSRLIAEVNEDSRAILTSAVRVALDIDPLVPVTTMELEGSPVWELARRSDETTLLVIGTHKTSFHYGRAFGSRSLQLASLARGAVAVIPEQTGRPRSGIVVGVDGTPAGTTALDLAADYAAIDDEELLLVRFAPSAGSADGSERLPGRGGGRTADGPEQAALSRATDRVRRRHPQLTLSSRLIHRAPGTGLVDVAQTARFLVIGDSRRAGAESANPGSVAYDVLLNLPSPTIVVHAVAGRIADDGGAD